MMQYMKIQLRLHLLLHVICLITFDYPLSMFLTHIYLILHYILSYNNFFLTATHYTTVFLNTLLIILKYI